ncbi:hypothetical protein BDC45DRAFT_536919 [Circinella umbellata]|nr:hypothetical protein BDC45DRAFT_536919 [Circinella umbellata]
MCTVLSAVSVVSLATAKIIEQWSDVNTTSSFQLEQFKKDRDRKRAPWKNQICKKLKVIFRIIKNSISITPLMPRMWTLEEAAVPSKIIFVTRGVHAYNRQRCIQLRATYISSNAFISQTTCSKTSFHIVLALVPIGYDVENSFLHLKPIVAPRLL